MSAQDNLNQVQFYHGTNAELNPGDVLTAKGANEYGRAEAGSRTGHVYATTDLEQAWTYARSRSSAADGVWHQGHVGHVYQVQPTGKVTADPNGYTSDSVQTRARLKVLGEVKD